MTTKLPVTLTSLTNVPYYTKTRTPGFVFINGKLRILWQVQRRLAQETVSHIDIDSATLQNNTFKTNAGHLASLDWDVPHYDYPQLYTLRFYATEQKPTLCLQVGSHDRGGDTWIYQWKADVADAEQGSFILQNKLPQSFEGYPAPAIDIGDPSGMLLSQADHQGYEFPSLFTSALGQFMVGYNTPGGEEPRAAWLTKRVSATTWEKVKRIDFNAHFPLFYASKKHWLIIGNILEPLSTGSAFWNDEEFSSPYDYPVYPGTKRIRYWPEMLPIAMIESDDKGEHWTFPRIIVNDPQAIQSRIYSAADGRIWMVYVQSHFFIDDAKTSCWITSSNDDGESWDKPYQITDGNYLDRDPDLILQDKQLYVTFARGGRGINTNIQVATVDVTNFKHQAVPSVPFVSNAEKEKRLSAAQQKMQDEWWGKLKLNHQAHSR